MEGIFSAPWRMRFRPCNGKNAGGFFLLTGHSGDADVSGQKTPGFVVLAKTRNSSQHEWLSAVGIKTGRLLLLKANSAAGMSRPCRDKAFIFSISAVLGERQMGIYQHTSTTRQRVSRKPTCLRCVLVCVQLPLALTPRGAGAPLVGPPIVPEALTHFPAPFAARMTTHCERCEREPGLVRRRRFGGSWRVCNAVSTKIPGHATPAIAHWPKQPRVSKNGPVPFRRSEPTVHRGRGV